MPNRFKKSMKHLAAAVCLTLSCVMPCAAQEFLPVSEVQEGMHGYAKTVVHGTKIETFDVDVLGIMKGKGATGGDLVLVKVSGPLIDQTEGIAQGMSGSPVYIDGKLLGAVAYGFPQSGGCIGMVTPIGDMLKLWTIDDRKDAAILQRADPAYDASHGERIHPGCDGFPRRENGGFPHGPFCFRICLAGRCAAAA